MTASRVAIILGVCASAALALGFAQPKTEPPAPPAKPADPPPAAPEALAAPAVKQPPLEKPGVSKLAFLTGSWRGTIGAEVVEEVWSAPSGDHVMGMFRWMNAEGNINMSEMLGITAEPDAVRLRLVHFSPKLQVMEANAKALVLRMTMSDPTSAEFRAEDAGTLDRVIYRVDGDQLAVDVLFKQDGGAPRKPLEFRMTRAGAAAK